MSTPMIEMRDVQKYFKVSKGLFKTSNEQVKAVDHITLTVEEGEIVGLVGESGSGKTTIGRAVIRVNPCAAGEILAREAAEEPCGRTAEGAGFLVKQSHDWYSFFCPVSTDC